MREKNAVSRSYLSSPERFAQIYNVAVFQGKQLIWPEGLRNLDSAEIALLWQQEMKENGEDAKKIRAGRKGTVQEGYRDIIKMYDNRSLMIICGIENQSEIHYAMPLRHLLYDALQYHAQWQDRERRHKKGRDLSTSQEFLSGIGSSERLIPVITLCVYWGAEPWTGPRNLHEMLDIPDELVHYKNVIGNYPLNLLEVCSIENLEDYSGELKALLGFLKYQKDKRALKKFVEENQELFRSMTLETAQAIAVLGNAGTLNRYLEEFEPDEEENRNDKERIDMCQALQEMMEDSRKEGIEQGMEIGIRMMIEDNLEEGICEERILEKLQRRFQLTGEEAVSRLNACRR